MASISSNGTGGGLWSATGTWAGGIVPGVGDKVTIAAGDTVTVDGTYTTGDGTVITSSTTAFTGTAAAVNVAGTLKASRLVNSSLAVNGTIYVAQNTFGIDYGTDADPIPASITAELVLNQAAAGYIAGLVQYTGGFTNVWHKWSFVGDATRVRNAKLTSTAAAAQNQAVLTTSAHNWQVGDRILFFTTTNNSSTDECEVLVISSISGATITFTTNFVKAHIAGSPACNLTSNVTIRSFSSTNGLFGYILASYPGSGTTHANGLTYNWENVRFAFIAQASGNSAQIQSGGGDRPGMNWKLSFCAFENPVNASACVFTGPGRSYGLDNCCAYIGGPVVGQSTNVTLTNCYIAGGQGFFPNGGATAQTHTNIWYTARAFNGGFCGAADQTFVNLTLSGCLTIFGGAQNLYFNGGDLGSTFGWKALANDNFYRLGNYGAPTSIVKDCLVNSVLAIPGPVSPAEIGGDLGLKLQYINKNQDPTQQELYYANAIQKRNSSTTQRSTSSIDAQMLVPSNIGVQPWTQTIQVSVANGATVRVIGYCQFDTTYWNSGVYTPPTVTISGMGITPVTYTATIAAKAAFEQFDISATNNVLGRDGQLTITFSAIAAAGATATNAGHVYFDGVPDGIFVTKARHYGFNFDETNPVRVVNPSVSASEATASGYTGISISGTSSQSNSTVTASTTFQKLFDYSQYWSVTNLAKAVPLSAAGNAGNITMSALGNVTINTGQVVNGAGAIGLGAFTLTTEFAGGGAYTYTGGTWSQATTVPSYNGGTLTMPAEGTYTFSATSPVIVLNPTANGATYDLSGCTFSGTVTFHNATAHTVTVDVPSGTTTSTTGNTGGAITISAPQIFQTVAVTGLTAGSRLQIYDTTNSVELYNAVVAGTSHTWTNGTAAGTYGAFNARVRVAYCTASTANVFIDTPVGTCGTTSGTAAVSYLASPAVDSVYVNNLIDGTAITDCAITLTNLHVDINTGSTSWQHIYAFMVYWLSTAVGIADQYLEMTATDQTHYTFASVHGGQFKIKNVTSPSVPLLITGGNAVPDTGSATAILDTTGGTIFCIEGTVVSFNTSDQSLNLATAQAAIDSRFDFPVTKRPAVDVDYVNAIKVNGTGAAASPWGP